MTGGGLLTLSARELGLKVESEPPGLRSGQHGSKGVPDSKWTS